MTLILISSLLSIILPHTKTPIKPFHLLTLSPPILKLNS